MSSVIVTVDDRGFALRETNGPEELVNPYSFFSCFEGCDIFSFT